VKGAPSRWQRAVARSRARANTCAWLCALLLAACESATDGDPAGDGGSNTVAPQSDPFELIEEDGLPVVHLWTSEKIDDDEHRPARLVYRGREYGDVQAKHRGQQSLKYPKKSYTVKLARDDLFDEPEHGMEARRRFVLTTTFDDNAYVRQRLSYELWNRLEPRIEVRTFHVVLYLDGRYHGLYLLGDHVDSELIEAHGLWPDGNLYKARSHEANLRLEDRWGEPKEKLETGYTKEEGEPESGQPGAFDDLHALIEWAATASDDALLAQLDDVLDRADFIAWYLLVSAIDATDSAGKNGYLYHDPRPDPPDARWHYVPWDFNASFGQDWQTWRLDSQRALSYYDRQNALFERFARVPELKAAVAERAREALAGEWSASEVLASFDGFSNEVADAAQRDEQRWGEAMRAHDWGGRKEPFTRFDEERTYVRQWLEERWALLDHAYR
jgi:spore coat protein CotH